MQRCLIAVNVHKDAISFFVYRLIYHVFKMSAFSTYACAESCTPLLNGCINCALSNAVPNVYLHTEMHK